MKKAIIVGDGPSARGFVPPAGVTVVAVKRTIDWLSRADIWFSLDINEASIERMHNMKPGVRYCCACDPDDVIPDGVERFDRVANRGRQPRSFGSPEWWLWRWSAVLTLCEIPGKIHTGNSAYGALGLLYHLGYRDVLLVGVDGTQATRISGGRPNNLSHLPALFRSAMRQVKIQSVGTLAGIPKTTVEDWLK